MTATPPDQISRQFRQPIVLILRPAILDRHVLALDVAGFAQPFAKRRQSMWQRLGQTSFKISDDWHSRLLPTRRKGPRDPRTAEQCDELAPSYLTDPHVPPRSEDRHRILPKMTSRGQGVCGHRTQRRNRRRPRD
jgi:hypothetical protein